jgi:hypothetical protein
MIAGLALVVAALAADGASGAAKTDVVEGFGPFTFGMPLSNAMQAVKRARLTRCAFPDHFKNCVEYDDKVYGMPATVRARFDPEQKLDAVFVQFDQLGAAEGSGACRKAGTAVLGQLRNEYGPNAPSGDMAKGQAKAAPAAKPKDNAKTSAAPATRTTSKPGAARDGKSAAAAKPENGAVPRPDLFAWFPQKGGKVGLVDLCSSDDSGVIYVIFTPSSVPGRKAS